MIAGVQIRFSQFVCSLGFSAVRDGVLGFVTASHCSDRQGTVDGTQYYQPLNRVPAEFIGTETVDPAYVRGSRAVRVDESAGFPTRTSARAPTGVGFDVGTIAKTTGPNNGSLEVDGTFTIAGSGPAAVGQVANKVGRTTVGARVA